MNEIAGAKPVLKCAVYTRKSTDEGLDQEFNTLDAQRESGEAYIRSQASEGWVLVPRNYDDGGFSGGNLNRPAMQQLLADVKAGRVNIIVVYKIDRLSRSLKDFLKLMELFEKYNASFVSVTQQFSTGSSMGRLFLNVMLSFAQFEREISSERIRDKIAASKKKGIYLGGTPPTGYEARDGKLIINQEDAATVRLIFDKYLELGTCGKVKKYLFENKIHTAHKVYNTGRKCGGRHFSHGHVVAVLTNPIYIGQVPYKGEVYQGQHEAIISPIVWKRACEIRESLLNHKKKVFEASKALLRGIIYDDAGNRMTPGYSQKKKRGSTNGEKVLYAYYISRAYIERNGRTMGSRVRIPGPVIEEMAWTVLLEFMRDNKLLIEVTNLKDADFKLRRKAMLQYLGKVVVSEEQMQFNFKPLTPDPLEVPEVRRAPYHRKFTHGVVSYYYKGKLLAKPPMRDTNLIKAVSLAWTWRKRMQVGEFKTLGEIARVEGYSDFYVRKIMPLSRLSPRIIEAVLDGETPEEFYMKKILKEEIPENWDEQWVKYGFHQLSEENLRQRLIV
jgi:site-specific DNA recombinase